MRRGKQSVVGFLFYVSYAVAGRTMFSYIFISFACLPFSYQTCDVCLQMGSKDNMTTLVIKMEAQKIGDGGGVMARRQQREAETNDENGQGSP